MKKTETARFYTAMIWTVVLLYSVVCLIEAKTVWQSTSNLNLVSPNYPSSYPPDTEIEWIFNQTSGRFAVTIMAFELEDSKVCENDYLRVYRQENGKPVALCGEQNFQTYLSVGPYLRLMFKSNENNQQKGFNLQVRHFYDEDDVREKILSAKKSAKVHLLMENDSLPPLLIGVICVLSLALAIFFAMLGILVIGIIKKNRERKVYSNFLHSNIISQMATTAGTGRKYSRSVSFSSEIGKPPLGPRVSNQSTRFVSVGGNKYPGNGVLV